MECETGENRSEIYDPYLANLLLNAENYLRKQRLKTQREMLQCRIEMDTEFKLHMKEVVLESMLRLRGKINESRKNLRDRINEIERQQNYKDIKEYIEDEKYRLEVLKDREAKRDKYNKNMNDEEIKRSQLRKRKCAVKFPNVSENVKKSSETSLSDLSLLESKFLERSSRQHACDDSDVFDSCSERGFPFEDGWRSSKQETSSSQVDLESRSSISSERLDRSESEIATCQNRDEVYSIGNVEQLQKLKGKQKDFQIVSRKDMSTSKEADSLSKEANSLSKEVNSVSKEVNALPKEANSLSIESNSFSPTSSFLESFFNFDDLRTVGNLSESTFDRSPSFCTEIEDNCKTVIELLQERNHQITEKQVISKEETKFDDSRISTETEKIELNENKKETYSERKPELLLDSENKTMDYTKSENNFRKSENNVQVTMKLDALSDIYANDHNASFEYVFPNGRSPRSPSKYTKFKLERKARKQSSQIEQNDGHKTLTLHPQQLLTLPQTPLFSPIDSEPDDFWFVTPLPSPWIQSSPFLPNMGMVNGLAKSKQDIIEYFQFPEVVEIDKIHTNKKKELDEIIHAENQGNGNVTESEARQTSNGNNERVVCEEMDRNKARIEESDWKEIYDNDVAHESLDREGKEIHENKAINGALERKEIYEREAQNKYPAVQNEANEGEPNEIEFEEIKNAEIKISNSKTRATCLKYLKTVPKKSKIPVKITRKRAKNL